MAWSKRNRLLLAIAVAVGLTAFVCIAVAIGAWRATVNQQAVATNASDVTTPSRVPNRAPTPVPRAPLEETSSPASSGTRTTLTPLTPLPSDNPTQRPTHQPTGAPTRPPIGFATTTPSRSPTQFPTSSPTQARSDESDRTLTTFYVVADVPYNQVEAAQLPPQVRNLPDDAEFLLHLGDIRTARHEDSCQLYEYYNVAQILRQSPVPVFMVIGDNEWNDCANIDTALGHWHTTFDYFEDNWGHSFNVMRPANRTENFVFFHKSTLFIGLNLVGGRVHSADEWKDRLNWEVQWTKSLILQYTQANAVVIMGHANPTGDHAQFFGPLKRFIRNVLQNGIPILYMNGDAHVWDVSKNFYDQSNFLRIQLTGGTTEPPLKMMVNASSLNNVVGKTFTYNRRLNKKN